MNLLWPKISQKIHRIMLYIKSRSEILRQFVASLDHQQKLAIHFSGTINQCLLLKTILCETSNQIVVYVVKNGENSAAQLQNNKAVLASYQNNYRQFSVVEITAPTADEFLIDDIFCHAQILPLIYRNLEKFDVYLISQDQQFFDDQFIAAQLYHFLSEHKLPIKFIAPFATQKNSAISAESFCGILLGSDLDFVKLYAQNQRIIDALKARENHQEVVKYCDDATDFNAIFRYLISYTNYETAVEFVRNFGDKISKEIYLHNILQNHFKLSRQHEDLIILGLIQAKVSNQELENFLEILVDCILDQNLLGNKITVHEIDYFFRLFDCRITQLARDNLAWKIVAQDQANFNQELLDKLVEWKADIGDVFLRVIDKLAPEKRQLRILLLLHKYRHKISPIQLNEALILSFENQLYQLCQLLIEAGADSEVLQFHPHSYAERLWSQNKSSEIDIKRNGQWRERDRVIISEILQELGNPQQKIPPVIHVTGSNGKGSVCAFMQSILQENGYKAHLFSTPAAVRGNEDIVIAGTEIEDQQYFKYLQRVEAAYHRIKDREDFKEKIAAANLLDNISAEESQEEGWLWYSIKWPVALLAFAENVADVTIVEVITGGERCLTNIFDEKQTLATVVNTIIFGDNHAGGKSYGDFSNIRSVGRTKSRLAKKNVPLISAIQEDSVMHEINQTVQERACPLLLFGRDFKISELNEKYFSYHAFGKNFKLRKPKLIGEFQITNAAIALTALMASRKFNFVARNISDAIHLCYRIGMSSQTIDLNQAGDKILIGWGKNDSPALQAGGYVEKCFSKKYSLALTFCSESGENISAIAAAFAKVKYDQRYRVETLAEKERDNDCFDKVANSIGLEFSGKNYLSSTINNAILQNKSGKKLLIHLNSRMKLALVGLKIFKQIKQSNYAKDLQFAWQNNLIDQAQYKLMQRSEIIAVKKSDVLLDKVRQLLKRLTS